LPDIEIRAGFISIVKITMPTNFGIRIGITPIAKNGFQRGKLSIGKIFATN